MSDDLWLIPRKYLENRGEFSTRRVRKQGGPVVFSNFHCVLNHAGRAKGRKGIIRIAVI